MSAGFELRNEVTFADTPHTYFLITRPDGTQYETGYGPGLPLEGRNPDNDSFWINGGKARDVLLGGAGADQINGCYGNDILDDMLNVKEACTMQGLQEVAANEICLWEAA